jgi:DNA replication protein DnaC
MHQHQNVVWLGISGCGKTGLATAFLIHAIDQGYRGRYVLFADLINELYAAVADHSENKVLKKYLAFDTLLIDELGYVEVEPVQVGLFFTLMHERHKKKPALIDRLTENSHVINMKGCKSLRSPLEAEPCAEP